MTEKGPFDWYWSSHSCCSSTHNLIPLQAAFISFTYYILYIIRWYVCLMLSPCLNVPICAHTSIQHVLVSVDVCCVHISYFFIFCHAAQHINGACTGMNYVWQQRFLIRQWLSRHLNVFLEGYCVCVFMCVFPSFWLQCPLLLSDDIVDQSNSVNC